MSDEPTAVTAAPPASVTPPVPPATPPEMETETAAPADLLGLGSGGEGQALMSPSDAAAAAVVAEGGLVSDGAADQRADQEVAAPAPAPAAAPAAPAATGAAVNGNGGGDVDVVDDDIVDDDGDDKDDSYETESSGSDDDSDVDDDDDDDSKDQDSSSSGSSDSESSSSSSEDPSVVTMGMRKSPPETLGSPLIGRVPSEDPELGVLTKEQVAAAPTIPHQASALYRDSYPAMDPRSKQAGDEFYAAYEDAMGEKGVLSDDDTPIQGNGRGGPRARRASPRRRGPVLGHDRASVRRMVVQRMKGKGFPRGGMKLKGMKRAKRRGADRPERVGRGGGRGGQEGPRRVSRRARTSPRGGEGAMGWSSPKRRRFLYGIVAVIIGVAGIALITYGANIERAYNRAKDDDYFYNDDDEGLYDDRYDDNEVFAAGVSPKDTATPTLAVIVAAPATSPPTRSPFANPVVEMHPDDALLSFLKSSYVDRLDSFVDMANAYTSWLDREAQASTPLAQQSLQWKAYQYLLNERDDVVELDPFALKMDQERVLQIYALTVFYETFGWTRPGPSECEWPGVVCRGLGVHADLDNVHKDDLRVVGIKASGLDGEGPLMEGWLPVELMFLVDLETLDVSHNLIGGRLSPALFQWKHMKVLELNDNRLEGDIPTSIGNMRALQKLSLHHNEFLGEVPDDICQLRQLTLHFLWADCSPMPNTDVPKVACPDDCCSICFEGYDDDGGAGTGGASPPARTVDTQHEVVNDNRQDLRNKLSMASADGGAALLNIHSPQFHAYGWLVEDDKSTDGDDDKYDDEQLFQRYALATLYFATNGEGWKRSGGWITSADECDWFGVSGCEADDASYTEHTVIAVNLKENQLEGTIPPELFEFIQNLVVLNLANNQLSGPIPKEIGELRHLDILELAVNQLTSIPMEMGQLEAIDHVFLQANDFGGQEMPSEVCRLRIEGSMTLLWADCRGDQPAVQCDSACCTTCFSSVSAYRAPDVGAGDEDEGYEGENSGYSHEPEVVTHADRDAEVLKRLKKMAPDNGKTLSNTLSPQFKAYSWLVGADASTYENLSDILLLQRYAMATLYFSLAGHGWTDKNGWLSDEDVCDWELVACNGVQMVTRLDFYSNNLVGRIPVEILHIRMLENLDFTDNELYGPIPTEFGLFEDMEILSLGGNLLTGDIPSELGNLATLHELYLHVNEFTATSIPNEICALRREGGNGLSTLWADCKTDENGDTLVLCEEGCCDECFDDYSDFDPGPGFKDDEMQTDMPTATPFASVPGRPFPPTSSPASTDSPTIPENPALKEVLLKHIGNAQPLRDRLADTSTPAHKAFLWLGSTRNYDELDDFSRLQRYGLATFYISTSPDIAYPWKVSNNWMSDKNECKWFGISCTDDINVSEISLPSNRLSGTIPPEIELAGLGEKLGKLNLSGNNIGDNIPKEIGKLKHLEVLDLRANDFTGQIPSEIGELTMLKSLDLQANELYSDMPPDICALRNRALEELIADCKEEHPFSTVTCAIGSCCTECY